MGEDVVAVFELHPGHGVPEEHRAQDAAAVLQGEVAMALLRTAVVRNLAHHPEVRKELARLQELLDDVDHGRDGDGLHGHSFEPLAPSC